MSTTQGKDTRCLSFGLHINGDKAFDSVAMKNAIQEQLAKQMQGLSAEERRIAMRASLEKSTSPMGGLWRRLGRRSFENDAYVAETGKGYGSSN